MLKMSFPFSLHFPILPLWPMCMSPSHYRHSYNSIIPTMSPMYALPVKQLFKPHHVINKHRPTSNPMYKNQQVCEWLYWHSVSVSFFSIPDITNLTRGLVVWTLSTPNPSACGRECPATSRGPWWARMEVWTSLYSAYVRNSRFSCVNSILKELDLTLFLLDLLPVLNYQYKNACVPCFVLECWENEHNGKK